MLYAWVLIIWISSNSETAISNIASQAECVRLAHELGQHESSMFGPKYECHRYQAAK